MSVDVSPDGQYVIFDLLAHVYRVPVAGGAAECLTADSGVALNFHPRYSPDDRSIAFVSDRAGQNNLWIMDADGSNPRQVFHDLMTRVVEPVWTPDGRELLYRGFGPHGGVMAATISSTSPFRVNPPRQLVELNTGEYDSTSPVRSWNVSPDGQRFLASRFERMGQPITTLHVVLNFDQELRRLVPSK